MRLRLTSIDEFAFLTCLQNELWGSKKNRFNNWREGDFLVIIVNKSVASIGEIIGKPFKSNTPVWDNGLFPYRIPVKFIHAMHKKNRPPVLGKLRDAITSALGNNYGLGILNQSLIESNYAKNIYEEITSHPNNVKELRSAIERNLDEAKQERANNEKKKPPTWKGSETSSKPTSRDDPPKSKGEESVHSKAQFELIKLGRDTGCSVWIASNDRNRKFKGNNLGEDCLNSLPSMGLNNEAISRISLIDVIWIQQNTPVSAFEIETTTSVYSGLLRMADLLAVVPAIKLQLYIVAPMKRQDKVMKELSRPTFQKIGLSDYCRFIPLHQLERLLVDTKRLEGHIQHSVIDSIAISIDDGIKSGLDT